MDNGSRRNILFLIIGGVAVFLLFDPFGWQRSPQDAPIDYLSDENLKPYIQAYQNEAGDAVDKTLALFDDTPLVLVGEHSLIKEEVEFFTSVLKRSLEKEVNVLGLEILLAEDQGLIDQFMEAESYDEEKARALVFNRMPVWGYQEYVDILKAAWENNHGLRIQNKKLKLVGLSYQQNYSVVKSQDDIRKPEIVRQVWSKGPPDTFMANRILEALNADSAQTAGQGSSPSVKTRMLVLCQRSFTLYRTEDKKYLADMSGFGYSDSPRMAKVLFDKLGNRSFSVVLLHSPWPYQKSPTRIAYPAEGIFDQVLNRSKPGTLPPLPAAFDLKTSLFGSIQLIQSDFFESDNKTPSLKSFGDVYVVLGALKDLHTVSPIEGFITQANYRRALDLLPAIGDSQNLTLEKLNESITRLSSDYQRALQQFK